MNDPCFHIDPVTGRCVADGIAGARIDLAAMPSVDIANGAPTGADATNELVDAWSRRPVRPQQRKDAAFVLHQRRWHLEHADAVSEAGDRSVFSAPAICPNGHTVYVMYMAFRSRSRRPRPIRGPSTASCARPRSGQVGPQARGRRSYSGPLGDARGSSQGRILYNEFLGDYVYAIATRTTARACGPTFAAPPTARRWTPGGRHRSNAGHVVLPGAVAARRLPGRLRQQRHLQRHHRIGEHLDSPGHLRSGLSISVDRCGFVNRIGLRVDACDP